MGIARFVGELMVNSMRGNPKDGTTFQAEGSADRQEILKYHWKLVRTVGVQAVIAHANAQPDSYPVQQDCCCQNAPTEHKKGSERPGVQDHQHCDDAPVGFSIGVDIDDVATHEISV